jgi:uncharacterized protein (UPF0332 family)
MAIINTLPKCLDSPYLFLDPDAPARVGKLLALAADRLEAACNIQASNQADKADVLFLSYEAMFNCLRALVYSKGYREHGLRCLILACEDLFVRTGQLDASHIHALERVQSFKADPEFSLSAAAGFVRRTLEILGQA